MRFSIPFYPVFDTSLPVTRFGQDRPGSLFISTLLHQTAFVAEWRRQALHQATHGTNMSLEGTNMQVENSGSPIDLLACRPISSDFDYCMSL